MLKELGPNFSVLQVSIIQDRSNKGAFKFSGDHFYTQNILNPSIFASLLHKLLDKGT